MSDPRSLNRSMFWRIERRLLSANRGRVFVILLALSAGAAVTAALFNLQVDAKRRLTTDFRSFGANVLITPRNSGDASGSVSAFPDSVLDLVPGENQKQSVARAGLLYTIADVTAYNEARKPISTNHAGRTVVMVGLRFRGQDISQIAPYTVIKRFDGAILDINTCEVGEKVASELQVPVTGLLDLRTSQGNAQCVVSEIRSYGTSADSQIFLPLESVQQLTGLQGRISLLQASVPGGPVEINRYISDLQHRLPNLDVRPIRQFTEGEAKIYNRIAGVLHATVAVILILTGLCVMAAMTNIAMERKNDVALMKAIGGAARRVLRLFLIEAALLGFVGGLLGAAFGLLLSIWLGKAVFGVAAQPRFIVYPVSVALTVLVAILGAFPLRRLVNIRPAVIFRGGE